MTAHEVERRALLAERRGPAQGAVLRAKLERQLLPALVRRLIMGASAGKVVRPASAAT